MTNSPFRVAIADDDRWMRALLQEILRKLGHEVVAVAETGRSLIEQCAVTEPDVIITDNLMPDISGVDAATIIYERRPTQVILLSGYCDRELVLAAEKKHVLMYLVKPVNQAHIEAALARCQELRAAANDNPEVEIRSFNYEVTPSATGTLYDSVVSPTQRPVRRPR